MLKFFVKEEVTGGLQPAAHHQVPVGGRPDLEVESRVGHGPGGVHVLALLNVEHLVPYQTGHSHPGEGRQGPEHHHVVHDAQPGNPVDPCR